MEAGTYTAKYRDGSGIVRKVATGCRDESAARSVLTELESGPKRCKGGDSSPPTEDAVIDHQDTPLADHVRRLHRPPDGEGVERGTDSEYAEAGLTRLAADCGFRPAGRPDRGTALERGLRHGKAEGMGAGNRNEYREELVGFGNWCVAKPTGC